MTNDNEKKLPRVWRHRHSGVWIGYLRGRSTELPDHLVLEGRRVWSWSGGRLECSQLAADGCTAADSLGDWTTVSISVYGSVELLPTTEEHVESARQLPRWKP